MALFDRPYIIFHRPYNYHFILVVCGNKIVILQKITEVIAKTNEKLNRLMTAQTP